MALELNFFKFLLSVLVFLFSLYILLLPFTPVEPYQCEVSPDTFTRFVNLLGSITAIAFSAFLAYVVFASL